MATHTEPDLYKYLDYRKYLEDWFGWKKVQKSSYSWGIFARRAGLKSSTITNIRKGRRHPKADSDTIAGIMTALELDDLARGYFQGLVALSTTHDRGPTLTALLTHPECRLGDDVSADELKYLSNWYYVAIRELSYSPVFREDPEWIAARLRGGVTAAQVTEALEALLRMGLLTRGPTGALVAGDLRLSTPQLVTHASLQQYHQDLLNLSAVSLAQDQTLERFFTAGMITVPEEMLPELRTRMFDFLQEMLHDIDQDNAQARRVFHLGMQLIPVTDVEEGEE